MIVAALLAGLLLGQSAPPRGSRAPATTSAATAVLSGQVVDDRGTPVPGAFVVAAGGPPLPGARTAMTSDSGRYVIPDLAPGLYTISAVRSGYRPVNYGQSRPNGAGRPFEVKPGQQLTLPITMPRGAVIAGMVVDDAGEPANGRLIIVPESTPAAKSKRTPPPAMIGARGAFRAYGLAAGTYRVYVEAPGFDMSTGERPAGMLVTVGPGEERTGVVVRAEPPRPRTFVTVAVTSSTGEVPKSLQLILRRAGDLRQLYAPDRPNGDGTHTLTDIAAGRYQIVARGNSGWGGTEVVVDGEHPVNAGIVLSPGVKVRGTVRVAQGAPRPPETSLMLSPADSASLMDDGNTALGNVTADGSFTLSRVPPGRYVLRPTYPPSVGWRIESAMWRDVDVADVPITIAYEDVDGIAVTLTPRSPMLTGRVTDAAGTPMNGLDVVLFPIDPALRLRNSRRVATARTSVAGDYEIRGLPPGDYGVALVDDVDVQSLRDPAVLAQLTAVSTVTLTTADSRHDVVVR